MHKLNWKRALNAFAMDSMPETANKSIAHKLLLASLAALTLSALMLALHPESLKMQRDNWWTISVNLIDGQGYSDCTQAYFPFCGPLNQTTASREPAPVLLFAIIARLSNKSLLAAFAAETLLFISVIWGVYLLTKQWANSQSAIIAAGIWTVYIPALRLTHEVAGDLLATVGITFGMYFVLRARKNQRMSNWLISGLWLGLGVMSRSAVLVIPLVIFVGLILEGRKKNRGFLSYVFPALTILFLAMSMELPWMVRNNIALGRPILGSSLTGYNIYRHNYMIETDDYFRYVGAKEGSQAVKTLLSHRPDLSGKENEAQMDLIYREEGLKIIHSNPSRYISLSLFRFLPLWLDWGINAAYGKPNDIVDYIVMVLQVILLILAIKAAARSLWISWPLWLSVIAISAAYLLIDSQLRYLVPVMPLVISLSANGLVRFLAERNKREVFFM